MVLWARRSLGPDDLSDVIPVSLPFTQFAIVAFLLVLKCYKLFSPQGLCICSFSVWETFSIGFLMAYALPSFKYLPQRVLSWASCPKQSMPSMPILLSAFFHHNAWYYLKLYYVFNYLLMISPLECNLWVQVLCLIYSCISSIQNSTCHIILKICLLNAWLNEWMNELHLKRNLNYWLCLQMCFCLFCTWIK